MNLIEISTPLKQGKLTSKQLVKQALDYINENDPKPFWLKIMGKPFDEATLLKVGYALEKKINIISKPSWAKNLLNKKKL